MFFWRQDRERFYLDEKTFDQIPASRRTKRGILGFTDFILTIEAIKHRAWGVLSYGGFEEQAIKLNQFLKRFPSVRRKFERSIWDSHTSIYSKEKGMTNVQMLRYRLERPGLYDVVQRE